MLTSSSIVPCILQVLLTFRLLACYWVCPQTRKHSCGLLPASQVCSLVFWTYSNKCIVRSSIHRCCNQYHVLSKPSKFDLNCIFSTKQFVPESRNNPERKIGEPAVFETFECETCFHRQSYQCFWLHWKIWTFQSSGLFIGPRPRMRPFKMFHLGSMPLTHWLAAHAQKKD